MTSEQEQQQRAITPYQYQDDSAKALASIAHLLKEITNLPSTIRREFRGEGIVHFPNGDYTYVQMTKPVFIRTDVDGLPLKQKIQVPGMDGSLVEREIYVPNDEAIEEILSIIKFMGVNQITPMTNLDENTILEDLKEFECKLAGILGLKQKEWGLDKELLPIIMTKIKTIIQDARYLSCHGNTIKALQKTIQRVEHYQENATQGRFNKNNLYS